jgi:ketosteroid isomerase-like protein
MKKITLISSCLMAFVLLTAHFATAQVNAEMKAKIDKMDKAYVAATMENNVEKMVGLYASDAISLPSYEPMHNGIAEIRKANEKNMNSGWKSTAFELQSMKLIPSGNMITEIGTYKITFKTPDMDKLMDDHGKYVTIWEKQSDGSLKIKVETWNSDVDPMSMMPMQQQTSK